MSVAFEENVRYVCEKCGWKWLRPVRVKLTPEIAQLATAGMTLSRPIAVAECKGCVERREES